MDLYRNSFGVLTLSSCHQINEKNLQSAIYGKDMSVDNMGKLIWFSGNRRRIELQLGSCNRPQDWPRVSSGHGPGIELHRR